MKIRRFLSGLVFGFGCALIFIGTLCAVLPLIPNFQLQLVLGSFALSSENWLVRLINRTMSYALTHSWRVLFLGLLAAGAGAWLLIYFSPPKRTPAAADFPAKQPAPMPEAIPVPADPGDSAPSLPNPFAVGTYLDHLPLRESNSQKSFIRHAAPILEPNRIDEVPLPPAPAPCDAPDENVPASEPFYSARFEAESQAIETERGSPSQSGSCILIRSTFDRTLPREHTEAQEAAPPPLMEERATPSSPQLSASAPMPPFSPRIRSTMGQKRRR